MFFFRIFALVYFERFIVKNNGEKTENERVASQALEEPGVGEKSAPRGLDDGGGAVALLAAAGAAGHPLQPAADPPHGAAVLPATG